MRCMFLGYFCGVCGCVCLCSSFIVQAYCAILCVKIMLFLVVPSWKDVPIDHIPKVHRSKNTDKSVPDGLDEVCRVSGSLP